MAFFPTSPAAGVSSDENAISANEVIELKAKLEALGRTQAVIEFELDGTIITANDNFLAATGYTLPEIQGKHHRMFVDPAHAATAEYQDFWRQLGNGQPDSGKYKRFKKDGSEIWIRASYNPIFDENGVATKIVKYAYDITETIGEIENGKRLYRMIDNMPIAVMYVDRDLIIRYMNPATITILRRVEDHLPMPVDKIMGACIDSFHRDPSHQRRLLDDPSNLPITTQIKLGEETLSFDVHAIYDDTGAYIGAMASGRVMTHELRTKEEAMTVSQSVATSTSEMAESIEEISKNVTRNASLASEAAGIARQSIESTDELQESSKAIGKVVSVIQELADQTNLLALNATIEAARAGESGRSFAVVANEVKDLARETSDATQSIEKSVSEIQTRVDEFATSTRSIGESIDEVSTNTSAVAAAIEEQSITMGQLVQTAEGLNKLAEA